MRTVGIAVTCPICECRDEYPSGETYLAPQEEIDFTAECTSCEAQMKVHVDITMEVKEI